ncbi:MAG: M15 family metallopeptidase [Oscillospiraceae bacterium]|nr:M15 family metallopeptidase [Oscillospiraceae bacterium]
MTETKNRASGSRDGRRPMIAAAALFLVAVLLLVLGVRFRGWQSRGEESRLVALVNPWNRIDEVDFRPRLKTVEGVSVDKSAAGPLEELLAACRTAGFSPQASEGYVDREEQTRRFEEAVQALRERDGMDEETARARAAETVPVPGTCEHELGLAVHLSDPADDEGLQRWLEENAWQYGFILRYPADGQAVTGVPYTPGHYRYVGLAAASQIYMLRVTLEEYIDLFYSDEAKIVFE